MNNSCPSCGAVYNVTAKDIGRRLKCKKCATPMTITEAGIEADEGHGSAPLPAYAPAPVDAFPEPEPVPAGRRPAGRGRAAGLDAAALTAKFGGVSTLVFGFGAFLVIFHLFQPLIGAAKVSGRQAAVDEERMNYESEKERVTKDKDIKEADRTKKLDDLSKEFEKDSKKTGDRAKAADISNRQSGYLERYFMMFGFLMVMVGSLGFLMPDQPPIKRVVGAIVITSQLVLVFIVFLGRSAAAG